MIVLLSLDLYVRRFRNWSKAVPGQPQAIPWKSSVWTLKRGNPSPLTKCCSSIMTGKVAVGTPTVAQASVLADVVSHIRGPKLIAFKMKRRKGYHRKVGHRQELTVVKIKEIKA